jgi:hypothetical protein
MARLMEVKLKYCTYEIWDHGDRSVRTVFFDGLSCGGMRDIHDPSNIREAREGQGYTGPDAVWRSLVEHELLHSLVSEILFDRWSLVLRSEAGDETFVSALDKYEEEAIVLACQRYANTGKTSANQTLSRHHYEYIHTRMRNLLRDFC